MASLITELTTVLNDQNAIYESLIDIAGRKKVSIIENDIPLLQKFVSEENTLIGKNQRLDKKRLELFSDIATVLAKPSDITLSDIIDAIKGQEEHKKLAQIKDRMLKILDILKTLNDQNQELIKMSIDYVNFSINVIRGANAPIFYDISGNEIDTTNKKMFDQKQ